MRKGIKLLLSLLIITIVITGCGKKNSYKNTVADNTVIIKEEKTVEKLKFSNLTLVYDDEKTYVIVDVKNTSNQAVELSAIKLTFYKNDNIIDEISTYIGNKVEASASSQIKLNYPGDLSGTTKVNYTVIK